MKKCPKCNKEFKSVQAVNAHLRSHTGYKSPVFGIMCCSILTKQEINVVNLKKHDQAYLNRNTNCKQCNKELTYFKNKDNKTKQFCNTSCAATWNNLHSSPYRKFGPAPKPKSKKEKYPYTTVYCNICKKTGRVFFSKTYRKYYPDLKETRKEYASSC